EDLEEVNRSYKSFSHALSTVSQEDKLLKEAINQSKEQKKRFGQVITNDMEYWTNARKETLEHLQDILGAYKKNYNSLFLDLKACHPHLQTTIQELNVEDPQVLEKTMQNTTKYMK